MNKGCCPKQTNGLKDIIKKFEETHSFEVKYDRVRKSIASTLVEGVDPILQKGMNNSVQTCRALGFAQCVDNPVNIVHKFYDILIYYQYKITHIQEMNFPSILF